MTMIFPLNAASKLFSLILFLVYFQLGVSLLFPNSRFLVVSRPKVLGFKTSLHVAEPSFIAINGDRFTRTAPTNKSVENELILTIKGSQYNMTGWANAHPGGAAVLKKFNGKDATKAFDAIGHSDHAYEMLKDFLIIPKQQGNNKDDTSLDTTSQSPKPSMSRFSRVRTKLFTREDPGIHKYCGIFVLGHFLYRFIQSYFGDPSAGFGTRLGKGSSLISLACIIPHMLLSLSSLIFHTVPKERVVGKPMIWQEYRMHNIAFGMRSVICTALAWLAVAKPKYHKLSVVGSSITVILALIAADLSTILLRDNEAESTTATMPYWEGCSSSTQRKFKSYYAFSQFMATIACLSTYNPIWPLVVLLPIQLASLLMTLVRKGLLSTKGYHIGYTISLAMPYFTALRSAFYAKAPEVALIFPIGAVIYQLRKKKVNKYVLWGTVVSARIFLGDRYLFKATVW